MVRYIGKLIGFCLLTVMISFGLLEFSFRLSNSIFLSVLSVIFPLLILFNYFMPWLFKEEVDYFNKKEGEKQNGKTN